MNLTYILAVLAILVAGWFLYRHDWKKKPLTDFTQHLEARDWRRYEFAICELQKRGQDVSAYLPRVISLLAADSKLQRAMGQRVIQKCYPEQAGEIAGSSPLQDTAVCRERVAALVARYPDDRCAVEPPKA